MQWDRDGNKHFSSAMEAVMFLQGATRGLVRWLHECRENGGKLFLFPQYRSVINDIGQVTSRWITEQERRISDLEQALHDARGAALCPSCGAQKKTKGELRDGP